MAITDTSTLGGTYYLALATATGTLSGGASVTAGHSYLFNAAGFASLSGGDKSTYFAGGTSPLADYQVRALGYADTLVAAITPVSIGAVATAQVGAASGVASLDGSGKVPTGQLPTAPVTSVNTFTGAVVLAASDVGAIPTSQKGAASGVAALDGSSRIATSTLPLAAVTSVNGHSGPSATVTAGDVGAVPVVFTRVTVTGNYTVQSSDRFVAVVTLGSPTTIKLPDATTLPDVLVTIKDETGNAGTNAVTIQSVVGTQHIDGGTTKTLSSAYAALSFYSNGTDWFTSTAAASATSGSAGGDLSGSYPNPVVAKVNGVTVGGTAAAGRALVATGASTAVWTDSTVGPGTFNVMGYGAVGNGQMVVDGAMTSGSAVLTCTTSLKFTSGDVGKVISVKGAASTGITSLVTTISSFTDSGHITLAANAATSITGALVMWGTDDTPAFTAAVNAAVTYAQGAGGAAKVFIPNSAGAFYAIGGALITGSPTFGNAQIPIPVVPTTANKVSLTIEGVGNGSALQHWQQTVPQCSGSTLVSFGLNAGVSAQAAVVAANGNPSVIGAAAQPGGYGISPGVFSNMMVTLQNFSILTTYSLYGIGYTAFDLSGVAEAAVIDFAYGTTGTVPNSDYVSPNQFANGGVVGALMPAAGNNDNCIVRNVSCHGGYTYAFFATEHCVIDTMRLLYSWSGLCPVGSYFGSVGATHAIRASQLSIEACTNEVYVIGIGSSGIGPFIDIDQLDTESGNPTFQDNTSGSGLAAALGTVRLTGLYTPTNITVAHPTGLKIIDGQRPYPVTAVSGNYTVLVSDDTLLVDATAGNITITLISALYTPNTYTVKKIDSSVNTVTISAAGGQTIDGAATKVISAQWASSKIIPSAGEWFTV